MHIFRFKSNQFSLLLMSLFILPSSTAVHTWHPIIFSYCSHVLRASEEEWQSISGDPIKYVQNTAPLQSQAATEISCPIITCSSCVANISPTDLAFSPALSLNFHLVYGEYLYLTLPCLLAVLYEKMWWDNRPGSNLLSRLSFIYFLHLFSRVIATSQRRHWNAILVWYINNISQTQ